MPVIDADTHVIECDDTWSYLRPEEQMYKPGKAEALIGDRVRPFWVVDGMTRIRSVRDEPHWKEMADLTDVPGRLKDMDELGVDIQVIYPTSFGPGDPARAEVEYALVRSYNRWMADRCKSSGGRLRWVMIPPWGSIDKAIDELRFAKDNGACGILKKGDQQAGHWTSEEYFFPVYSEAEKLDLPICFHVGTAYQGAMPIEHIGHFAFYRVHLGVVHSFQSVLSHQLSTKFPKLRWGFVEATASWVPFVLYGLRRMIEADKKRPGRGTQFIAGSSNYEVGDNVLARNNMFVVAQVDEDLPYLLKTGGEDYLMVGSDYTHQDAAQELQFMSELQTRVDNGEISATAFRKMTQDNPKRFYGL